MEAKMEIRKSGSTVFNGVQNNSSAETEKKADKSLARGTASSKDSFEVSSSSNQENSGQKDLSAAQQQEASKMNYKDYGSNGSASQNSRPTYEDAKNSGLAARLGHNKESNEADSKKQLPNGVTVADIKNSAGQAEQSSAAVKDAQQKLNGGTTTNYRESLDQELARRRQDFTAQGGSSAIDRALGSRPDLDAAPKGKGSVPTGADAVAYQRTTERQNKDGSTTVISDSRTTEYGVINERHIEATTLPDHTTVTDIVDISYYSNNMKVESKTKEIRNADLVVTNKTTATTVTDENGKIITKTTETTTTDKDGVPTTTTTTTGKPPTVTMGAPLTPSSENRDGNIPEDIKKGIEYDMQQIRNQKPKSGGETELTDGGVTGNSADGSGPINNAFTRTGGVMGAVAQPTRAGEYVGGSSNVTVGSAVQNGGATDSLDGSSWTGTTHQDDPADVQFGPADQPKEQTSKKSEDSQDSSTPIFDLIANQKRR